MLADDPGKLGPLPPPLPPKQAPRLRMNVETFRYDNRIVRAFAIATIFWGIVGMAAGLLIATQLFFPKPIFRLPLPPSAGCGRCIPTP
jgi:cbb3-type cytochrome oxidase subunit 1